jgi:hypothetical protein
VSIPSKNFKICLTWIIDMSSSLLQQISILSVEWSWYFNSVSLPFTIGLGVNIWYTLILQISCKNYIKDHSVSLIFLFRNQFSASTNERIRCCLAKDSSNCTVCFIWSCYGSSENVIALRLTFRHRRHTNCVPISQTL